MKESAKITTVYGDQLTVSKRHLDNPRFTFIPIVGDIAEGDASCVHRGNIIKPDTIGYQVVNADGDFWEHESHEIIEDCESAYQRVITALCRQPDSGWHTEQVAEGVIENPSFI